LSEKKEQGWLYNETAYRNPKLNLSLEGEKTMDMSTIADWCTILFFLWFGLKKFIPALDKGYFSTLGALIALAAAITTILDRSA
jgi:hypothetical protein